MPAVPVAVPLVLGLVSTAYAAYAQKAAGDFQAAIARRNADAQEKMAQDAQQRGLEEGIRSGLAGGVARGSIRAGYGASGVEVNTGSPLDVLSDAAMYGALDRQTARSNAERQAYAFRVGGANYLAQADSLSAMGTNQAIGTSIAGLSQAAGRYYELRK